jgi:hypothetical protein
MKARQLIGGASFPPDVLSVAYEAFDDAWLEVAPDVSSRPQAIESARMTLAGIVLSLARAGPVDQIGIKTAAVDAFRQMYRIPNPS